MNRFSKQHGAISAVRPKVGGDLFGIMVLVVLLAIFSLIGCQDSFMKQTTADKTSAIASLTSEVDAAGNVSANFDPNSSQTQVLQLNSGSIAGAAVAIPPGSLSIPVSVVVGEGESLASSSFSQQIGLTDNTISASGPSVSFIPSQNVQATNPFTLAIPFSAVTALSLNDAAGEENLVVMFRSIKVENGTTSYSEGVIPREQITVARDKVTFQTTNFGLFQVGVAQTKVREKIEKPAAQPPALIAEVGSPLIGVWGQCEMAKEFPDPNTVKIPDGFFGTKTSSSLGLYDPGTGVPGPDCASLEVTFAKDHIFLPKGFIGDPVQLIINNTSFNFAKLQDLVQKEAADVHLISATMAEIKTEGDPEGGVISLPKGCGFTRDGKTLLSSFFVSSKDFTADDQKVCRYDITFKQPDVKIVCAGAQIGPSVVLDMVKDGEQWFGRVSGQVYSKRESLRFNRTEVFHTLEYFKSKDCTGVLVSSKTESGAYALPEVDVSGTIPIDMKFYKASGKIVGGDWFKSLNRAERYIGSCGISDWKIGEERDLPADKTCFSPFKVSPRMQVTGDELQICGAKEEDVLNRPEDCAEILQTFKRPPKR
jgi:hypothetical protein